MCVQECVGCEDCCGLLCVQSSAKWGISMVNTLVTRLSPESMYIEVQLCGSSQCPRQQSSLEAVLEGHRALLAPLRTLLEAINLALYPLWKAPLKSCEVGTTTAMLVIGSLYSSTPTRLTQCPLLWQVSGENTAVVGECHVIKHPLLRSYCICAAHTLCSNTVMLCEMWLISRHMPTAYCWDAVETVETSCYRVFINSCVLLS